MSKSVYDLFLEQLDNQNEFESFAESGEMIALDGFEFEAVEFEPYDTEGMTTYGNKEAN